MLSACLTLDYLICVSEGYGPACGGRAVKAEPAADAGPAAPEAPS